MGIEGRRAAVHGGAVRRTRGTFLNFSPPSIGESEIEEVIAALRSGWLSTGPRVHAFEKEFAAFVGAAGAVALSSGTAALHIALVLSGVGPGDVVITTPMTFCSSVHVIEHVGARPLLVDVAPDTLNIDAAMIARAIQAHSGQGGRIRAILPVHLYGHPCEMEAILQLAHTHRLAIIEDAAHALPARYQGQWVGSGIGNEPVPRFVCFSFYATKNLTTGEGGMLIAPPGLEADARAWALHGMNRDAYKRYTSEGSWFYEVRRPGFKYNMSDIHAALGLQQLRRLPGFQSRRREIVRRFHEAFGRDDHLQIPVEREDVEHAWHLYPLRLNTERFQSDAPRTAAEIRQIFIERLKARNIGASVHFIPIHLLRYYGEKYGYTPTDFPVALDAYNRLVSLPLYPRMTDADVEDVIGAVRDVIDTWGRPNA